MAARSRWMACLCVSSTLEENDARVADTRDDSAHSTPDKAAYTSIQVHNDEQGSSLTVYDDEQEVLPAAPSLPSDSASSSQHNNSMIRACSSRRLSDLGSAIGSSGSDAAAAKDMHRAAATTPTALVHQFMQAYEAALQDTSTPALHRHMEHLFTHDAKLTTVERSTVHGRRGVLGRLEKGVQQLQQMAAAGDAAQTGVHVGDVQQEGADLFVVGLRLQRGVLKLGLRVEFGVRSMENGAYRIHTLAFRRG